MTLSYKDFSVLLGRIRQISSHLQENNLVDEKEILNIENRIKDSKYYIGVIGESNAGKSTMINSILKSRYLPNESVEHSSFIPVLMEYGMKPDFRIEFIDGRIKYYSRNRLSFLKEFLPLIYSKLSFFQKEAVKAKDLAGIREVDEWFLPLFRKLLIYTNDTIKCITIFDNYDILKNGIVIVDFPAFHSLGKDSASNICILNRCDKLFVILSADKKSDNTTSFLSQLIIPKEHIVFFVSKLECLHGETERINKLKDFKTTSHISSAKNKIVPCPSLYLMIKEKQITQDIEWLKSPDELFDELCEEYLLNSRSLIEKISDNIEHYVCLSLIGLVKTCIQTIILSIQHKVRIQISKQKSLEQKRKISLVDFQSKYIDNDCIKKDYEIIKNQWDNKKEKLKEEFVAFFRRNAYNRKSKDEIQRIFKDADAKNKAKEWSSELHTLLILLISNLRGLHKTHLDSFIKALYCEYNIEVINSTKYEKTESIKLMHTKIKYDSYSLTTFKPLRFFKNISTVRNQVLRIVDNAYDLSFKSIFLFYEKNLNKEYATLYNEYKVITERLLNKNQKKINTMIKQELEEIQKVTNKLKQLQKMQEEMELYYKDINKYYNISIIGSD